MLCPRLCIVALIGFAAIAPIGLAQATTDAAQFPLDKGTYWVYRGTVAWWDATKDITWESRVTDTIDRGAVKGALLHGTPYDLAWHEEGDKPGKYLIIMRNDSVFLLVDERVKKTWTQLKNKHSHPDKLLTDNDELIFSFPLHSGKRWGDPESMNPDNPCYCWVVENERDIHLAGVQGVDPESLRKEFEITFRTNVDHQIVNFIPGVGITRYRFSHHGSTYETDVRLVEFHHLPFKQH